jgi:TfoX/Sxy family transcriptional regulator of competence genes
MKLPKPTDDDRALFAILVPTGDKIQVKPMFGNLGAFVDGNMFMGLFGSDIGLRLPGADAAALRAIDGAGPFGPPDRPMAGYVAIPAAWRAAPDEARPWIVKSLNSAQSLPPKARSRKKR